MSRLAGLIRATLLCTAIAVFPPIAAADPAEADPDLAASDDDLEAVEGVGTGRAKDIREGLRRLQEVDPVDRYLQS